jgi:hypothetical protein
MYGIISLKKKVCFKSASCQEKRDTGVGACVQCLCVCDHGSFVFFFFFLKKKIAFLPGSLVPLETLFFLLLFFFFSFYLPNEVCTLEIFIFLPLFSSLYLWMGDIKLYQPLLLY